MKNITPHLWFDKEAREAAGFYVSVFPNSKITFNSTIRNVPSPTGETEVVSFELNGHPYMAISAGPGFKTNPSISFIVNFDPSKDKEAERNIDVIWKKFSDGGKVLMPLDKYFFARRYGWVQDKYGVSWQLILTDSAGEERPYLAPSLMFTKAVAGKAEEAVQFYTSVFKDSHRGRTERYPKGMEPNREGTLMFSEFTLSGQWFAAMDNAQEADFSFTEGISLLIPCENQREVDYFWDKLSANPEAEACGWLKDKFGVSWQVWPTAIGEMLRKGDPGSIDRLTQAILRMKKFDVAKLRSAFEG